MPELNLVLLGPPGSGKGKQGERLNEDLRLPYYATGDILRGWASRIREEARQSNAEMLHGLEDSIATHLPVAEQFTRAMTRRWLDLVR